MGASRRPGRRELLAGRSRDPDAPSSEPSLRQMRRVPPSPAAVPDQRRTGGPYAASALPARTARRVPVRPRPRGTRHGAGPGASPRDAGDTGGAGAACVRSARDLPGDDPCRGAGRGRRVAARLAFFGYDEPNYTYMKDGTRLLSQIAALSPVPVYVRAHNLLTSGDGSACAQVGLDECLHGRRGRAARLRLDDRRPDLRHLRRSAA